jgi:hypothetical protein
MDVHPTKNVSIGIDPDPYRGIGILWNIHVYNLENFRG